MMAPYGAPMMLTLLKNPELGNEESADVVVGHRKAMDGTRYSYVKTSDKVQLNWSWRHVDRGKLIEVEEFVRAFTGEEIQLVDWNGDVWRARLLTTPSDFEINVRSSPCLPGNNEAGDFTLRFLARRLTPNVYGECDGDLVHEIAFIQNAQAEIQELAPAANAIAFGQDAAAVVEEPPIELFMLIPDPVVIIPAPMVLGEPLIVPDAGVNDPEGGV